VYENRLKAPENRKKSGCRPGHHGGGRVDLFKPEFQQRVKCQYCIRPGGYVRISLLTGLFACIVVTAPALTAASLFLNPSDVIGASGSYSGAWNDPTFGAQNILNQQTGSISETSGDGSYWINPDNGPANAYIVIDLGAQYQIGSIALFNTHNGKWNDRGTGDFKIEAGNSLGALTANGYDLSGTITTILTGTLVADTSANPSLTEQDFTVSDLATYRYLRFDPLSVASQGASCCGTDVYGLNELRVSSVDQGVPEPATWLAAAPLLALLWKRRARGCRQ